MLSTTRIGRLQKSYSTVIFVEGNLFIYGISHMLNVNNQNIQEVEFEQLFSLKQKSTYICNVKYEEVENRAEQLLLHDNSINIFIIKNNIEFEKVKRLLKIGVKGICSTDIDEKYLIHAVDQVQNGHIFIEQRSKVKIIKEYIDLLEMNKYLMPVNDLEMKKIISRREIEILRLLVKGYTNNQISEELSISEKTVKNHVSNMLVKLEVNDRLNAVLKALRNNWIQLN